MKHLRIVVCFLAVGLGVVPAASAKSAETLLERAYGLDADMEARNAAAAAALYAEAAEAGDGVAHLRLGYLYETGDGVPQDYALAREHYVAAIAAGVIEAHLRLAMCHLEGWGGPVDRDAFVSEVRLTAEAGYVPGQRMLAAVYFFGVGVPRDAAKGVSWMERAAQQNDAEAQYWLGRSQNSPVGLIHNVDRSAERNWYQLSAEQDYAAAMSGMARSFLNGRQTDRDWQLAKQWLLLADEAGDPVAPYNLAVCAVMNQHVPVEDRAKAQEWFEQSASRDHPPAVEVLELVKGGRSLADAVRYVLGTSFEERYVQKMARKAPTLSTEGNQVPRPIRMVRPIYPMSLRLAGITGEAMIEFVVDVTGRVSNPTVVSATHPLFGERGAETVAQWRFTPGRQDGRLVKTRMRIPVIFKLSDESINGVQGLLGHARDRAAQLGKDVEVDARHIAMGRSLVGIGPFLLPNGQLPPVGSAGLILLVIDPQGRVLRGHILESEPAEIGPPLLDHLSKEVFFPVREGGVAVEGSIVMAFRRNEPVVPGAQP